MANNIRDVRNRINSTKKTAQITKAMNMVSASKLRGAEKSIKEFGPFMEKAKDIIVNIASSSEEFNHPLLEEREIKKTCYVLIASDKGLAGAFNANACKALHNIVSDGQDFCVMALGYKSYTYCQKNHYEMVNKKPIYLRDDVDFDEVYNFTHDLVMNYLMKKFDQVIVVYNHFVNTLVQEAKTAKILPINKDDFKTEEVNVNSNEIYDFEGGSKEILNIALPIYLENYIYGLILDSKASEHASRMNSMKSASDNASEIIASLQLLYNRARQAAITLELTDIVGGASVINNN